MSATLAHGEFLNILDQGILITGPAGIGKSTLALELLDRGHQLIADDAVLFHVKHDLVTGRCPDLLKNYLSIRDLGILNVCDLYGTNTICPAHRLDLVIHLCHEQGPREPNLRAVHAQYPLLGLAFPQIDIMVAKYRNLALVIETAVKNHILYRQGNDANQQLIKKQQHFI